MYKTEEISGRTRRFRYFSQDGWQLFNKSMGKEIDTISLSESHPQNTAKLVEPTSINEINLLYSVPNSSRKRKSGQTEQKLKPTKKRKASQDQTVIESYETQLNFGTPAPKKTKAATYDITRSRRIAILLDMLEKQHIIVVGPQLLKDFHEIEKEAPDGQCIARTTFDNMVKTLHSKKQLTAYVTTIKKPYGLPEIKTLLLHSSLDENSEEVKEFIEQYGIDQQLMQPSKKQAKLKVVDVQTLPSLHPTQEKAKKIQFSSGLTSSWRYSAIEYGWINSKWLRARVLHEAMFEYHENHGKNQELDMARFLKSISLRTLMAFFGILPFDNPELVSFLNVDENRDIAINDLPPNIRHIVVSAVPKIRSNVIRLLHVLKALGVVESNQTERLDVLMIEPKLTLSTSGIVRDYKVKHHPVREVVQFDTISDIQYFWIQLQSCCTERTEVHEAEDNIHDSLKRITMRRTWNANTLLTKEQKEILDSFIDKDAQTVPDEKDLSLRMHIAKKTGLTQDRIRTYYRSILVAFKKYETKKEKAKKKTERMAKSSPAIQELMKASLENRKVKAALFKMKSEEPFVESTYIGSRKMKRLKVVVHQEHAGLVRKVTKDPFTQVEKDLLIYAYCIMKTRSKESTFWWSPISKVIPNHSPERCRRVFTVMMRKHPNFEETIENIKSKWIKIYKKGIETNELKDEKPWDNLNFDLDTYLEYFLIKLKEER